MNKQLKIGYFFAYLTMFAWSVQMVISRYAGTTLDASPFVFVTTGLFIGSFVLVMIGGQGSKAIDSMRSGHTWLYSLFQLSLNIGTMVSMLYVTSTQSMFLQKINILMALFIGLAFYDNRKVSKNDLIGCLIVLAGVVLMFSTVPSKDIIMAVISILFIAFCHVMRTNIAERHEIAKNTRDFHEHCRVTGYVLLSTSLLFLVLGLGIAGLKSLGHAIPFDMIPTKELFITKDQLVLATMLGLFIIPVGMYSYFYASRALKSENMVIITAYLPLFTFAVESIAAYFGLVELRDLIIQDYISAALIVGGATYITMTRNKAKKAKQKLAPRHRNELNVLRETIMTAKIAFDDDMALVAKKLGVAQKTIKKIMTTDEQVSKAIKNKIVFNHADNVAGVDHLTGSLNKISFDIKLQQLDSVEKALLLFIDLDKFKPVNDTYGHDAGDAILKGISERLMAEFKQPNAVARLGGDEYCVLVYGADKSEIEKYKKIINSLVTNSFIVEDIEDEISVGCSIGAAHYPIDTQNGLELKGLADKEMYKHKNSKGNVR